MRVTIFNPAGGVGAVVNIKAMCMLLCLVFMASGCSFIKLQRNVNELEQSIILGGRVQPDAELTDPSIVVVYKQSSQGYKIVDFQHTDSTGHYLFIVPRGQSYYMTGFSDTNNNLVYDPGEPAGYYGEPTAVSESMEDDSDGANITLATTTILPEEFPRLLKLAPEVDKNIPLIFGEITSLSDKRFSRENARQGLWAPLDFAKKNGVGIFFLEKYDPNKTPILFIHGSGGTPSEWQSFIDSIDHDRYQPWLFYYPTGVRLTNSTRLLTEVLGYFQKEYDIKNLYIIAHSIGGLVARSYLVNNIAERQPNLVKLFVSISTPWKGHPAAAKGVRNAPAVIPVWMDIQPESDFISSLFRINLGSRLTYYLLFSYDQKDSIFGLDNDGAVTLNSELDYRAQSEAKKIFGFNDNHRQILQDETVIRLVNEILSEKNRTSQ